MRQPFEPNHSKLCICLASGNTLHTIASGVLQPTNSLAHWVLLILAAPAALSLMNAMDSVATTCSLHTTQLRLYTTALADLGSLSSIGVLVLPQWQPAAIFGISRLLCSACPGTPQASTLRAQWRIPARESEFATISKMAATKNLECASAVQKQHPRQQKQGSSPSP